MQKSSGILILTGETASGKSDLAVALAERYDAEIIGADSRQIYRGMPIGTAAPNAAQRARVPHHLVECVDPFERYSAGRYVADAIQLIDAIHARNKRVIVVGGTGFYVRALCGDVDLGPQVDTSARQRMQRESCLHDGVFLHAWLTLRNPRRAAELSHTDTYRVIRALETVLAHKPAAEVLPVPATAHENLRSRGISFLKIWLQSEREMLQTRIDRRVDVMLADGFIAEAERVGPDAVAASAVGYPHALAYLAGQLSLAELRAHMIRATRRYAKRQATWLRAEPALTIVAPGGNRFEEVSHLTSQLVKW